jgi:hypothetical protein
VYKDQYREPILGSGLRKRSSSANEIQLDEGVASKISEINNDYGSISATLKAANLEIEQALANADLWKSRSSSNNNSSLQLGPLPNKQKHHSRYDSEVGPISLADGDRIKVQTLDLNVAMGAVSNVSSQGGEIRREVSLSRFIFDNVELSLTPSLLHLHTRRLK